MPPPASRTQSPVVIPASSASDSVGGRKVEDLAGELLVVLEEEAVAGVLQVMILPLGMRCDIA
jgi:hypothetical protein